MKALVASTYGPIEDVTVTDVTTPVPGPGQVLVRVQAAGLNPLDVKLATGVMREVMPVEHPFVLGVDAAGVVEAVGEGVTRFAPGDEVVALTFPAGAVAEYTVVYDGPTITHRPAGLSAERAAALPTPVLMGAALASGVEPYPGQNVLVVGAQGAVSSFFLQLVADQGLRVLGTATPEDADRVRSLGVKDVVDHTSTDVAQEVLRRQPGGVDVAIDLVNVGPGLAATAAAVKPGGRLLSAAGGPPEFDRGVSAVYLGVEEAFGRFDELVGQVASGRLSVDVVGYPFAEATRALAEFVARRSRARVVITL